MSDPHDDDVIRLNPDDPTFALWQTRRDDSGDPQRAPGPINVQKWPAGWAYQGIPTFFRLPVALTLADLKAGAVDVAILGAPVDITMGMRGCAWGPQAVRTAERSLAWGAMTVPNTHVMVDPFQALTVVDYGDAPVEIFSVERTMPAVRAHVREVVEAGVIPLVVGGDHSLMWPDAAALQDVYGRGKVGVLHFDAHYDAYAVGFGHLMHHGMPVRRLLEDEGFPGRNIVQVGLRGYTQNEAGVEYMRGKGVRAHYMAEVDDRGWAAVMETALAEALDGPEYLFISLDVDVLDPAFAPGTGAPAPGGLTTRELFPMLRRLCAEQVVKGIEVVEFNPQVDPGYTTGLNVLGAIREMLTGLAMQKLGKTEKNYLDPRTSARDKYPPQGTQRRP